MTDRMIRGEVGDVGETGATGATGAPGAPGDTGATGARGLQGPSDYALVLLISSSLERLEGKTDRIAVRIDNLVETTNHRLDSMTEAINLKANVKNLGPVFAQHLSRSKFFWTGALGFAALATPVIVDHWHLMLDRIDKLPFGF